MGFPCELRRASVVVACTWESYVAVGHSFERVDVLLAVDMLPVFSDRGEIESKWLRAEI